MTSVSAPSAFSTAPLPRPPQPITPMRIGSSGAAWLVSTKGNWLTVAAPAAASEEFLRNERRERAGVGSKAELFICREFAPVAWNWKTKNLVTLRGQMLAFD